MVKVLGFSRATLNEYFREELETGLPEAIMRVAATVYGMAIGSPGDPARGVPAVPPDKTCAFFYLKCRGGWRETANLEVSGRDGGPIEHEVIQVIIPDNARDPTITRSTK